MLVLRNTLAVTAPQPHLFDIREYGATGDSDTTDTEAIQAALDASTAGGTTYVPPGTYRTGPLRIGSQTTLRLEAGATLQFVRDFRAFPTVESRWEGWDQVGFHPCLFVKEAETVEITGRGTIDGSGSYWWQLRDTAPKDRPEELQHRLVAFEEHNAYHDDVSSFTTRPPLLQVYDSENVSISGVRLRNSPFWNTHIVYSEDVTIHDVRIENPPDAPNGDGIDIDSSVFVRVSDTFIDAGDDAICIKSGKDEQGRAVDAPAENITVTNCTIKHGHGGIVIGSETAGDVRHVVVSNCTFSDTDRGVRIKSQRGRGGVVEDLRFDTIVMRGVVCPFVINGYYFTDINSEPESVGEGTPTVRNVHFHHITAHDAASAGFMAGLPEQPFSGISLTDVRIDATRSLDETNIDPAMAYNYEPTHGLFCISLADISCTDVYIRTADGPALTAAETESLRIDGLYVADEEPSPTIQVNNVEDVRISGCSPSDGTFLRASGKETRRLSLSGNHGDLTEQLVIDETTTLRRDRVE